MDQRLHQPSTEQPGDTDTQSQQMQQDVPSYKHPLYVEFLRRHHPELLDPNTHSNK